MTGVVARPSCCGLPRIWPSHSVHRKMMKILGCFVFVGMTNDGKIRSHLFAMQVFLQELLEVLSRLFHGKA